MSAMERRLQLLLDQDRYDRLAAEAASSGRSVAAVIREAIDLRLPDGRQERADAVREFLALPADTGAGQSPEEISAELDAEFERRAGL